MIHTSDGKPGGDSALGVAPRHGTTADNQMSDGEVTDGSGTPTTLTTPATPTAWRGPGGGQAGQQKEGGVTRVVPLPVGAQAGNKGDRSLPTDHQLSSALSYQGEFNQRYQWCAYLPPLIVRRIYRTDRAVPRSTDRGKSMEESLSSTCTVNLHPSLSPSYPITTLLACASYLVCALVYHDPLPLITFNSDHFAAEDGSNQSSPLSKTMLSYGRSGHHGAPSHGDRSEKTMSVNVAAKVKQFAEERARAKKVRQAGACGVWQRLRRERTRVIGRGG